MPLKREVYPMTRLSIETPSSAEVVLRGLYRDIERRISASSPGLCPIDMSLSFLRLCHAQTCGKCVPCRIGLGQLATLIESVMNRTATLETIDRIERTAKVIADSADCAIGYEAAVMVLKGVKGFRDDYEEHILRGRCITDSPIRFPASRSAQPMWMSRAILPLSGKSAMTRLSPSFVRTIPFPVSAAMSANTPVKSTAGSRMG